MNNYLSNLVGKALNQVPLARPHRAPLFAPTPYASGSLGGHAAATPFPSRFAFDEADASLEAPHNAFTSQNSRRARTVSTPDDGSHNARQRIAVSGGMSDGHGDESHEKIFAASSPAPFAPPPPPTHLTPAPQTIISPTPRAANDEANPDTIHATSFTRAESDRARRRGLLETTRPLNADAPDAATRDTEATLARLRQRLSRDEGEARQLEGEFAAARTGVLNLNADAALQHKSQARALPSASEDDTRAEEQERRAREHLRAEEVAAAAAARRAKSPASPGRGRALQLKPAPSVAAHTSRRGNSADVKPNAPVPTIQVTIGRIEVRATHNAPASASTNRQSAAAPRLSLDEYLRQRNGGGAR